MWSFVDFKEMRELGVFGRQENESDKILKVPA